MAQIDQRIFFGQSAFSEFHTPDGTQTDNGPKSFAHPTQGGLKAAAPANNTAFDKLGYPSGLGLSRITNPA